MLSSSIEIQNIDLSIIYLTKKELIYIVNSNFTIINGSLQNICCPTQLFLINVGNSLINIIFLIGRVLSQNFLYSTKSSVFIEKMKLIGNLNYSVSAIYSDKNKILSVNDSTFSKFSGKNGGAISNIETIFNLSYSSIVENFAVNGGGIYTSNSMIFLVKNTFYSNILILLKNIYSFFVCVNYFICLIIS